MVEQSPRNRSRKAIKIQNRSVARFAFVSLNSVRHIVTALCRATYIFPESCSITCT